MRMKKKQIKVKKTFRGF